MPTINKPEKKTSSERNENTDMRKLRREAYNNTTWRKLRETYMREHPICERCLEKGKVTPAEDIHHIKTPFRNGVINYGLLFDDKNLMALCKECHGEIHAEQQGHVSVESVIAQLDALMDDNISDKDIEDGNY